MSRLLRSRKSTLSSDVNSPPKTRCKSCLGGFFGLLIGAGPQDFRRPLTSLARAARHSQVHQAAAQDLHERYIGSQGNAEFTLSLKRGGSFLWHFNKNDRKKRQLGSRWRGITFFGLDPLRGGSEPKSYCLHDGLPNAGFGWLDIYLQLEPASHNNVMSAARPRKITKPTSRLDRKRDRQFCMSAMSRVMTCHAICADTSRTAVK